MSNSNPARVAVITGASAGVGKAAAIALAQQGWRVIGLGRDPARCAQAEADIRAAAPGAELSMIQVDLALLSETARAADEVLARTDRVNALLNNAGGIADRQIITAEGNEATFSGNHLGHFLLTRRLLPLLRTAAASAAPGAIRIVAVSSTGHTTVPGIDWDDLQRFRNFTPGGAYSNAKLANILFTRALARRLGGEGIVAHAMHPGVVNSNFFTHGNETTKRYMESEAMQAVTVTPEQAADTLVWLASAEEPGRSNGAYYHQRQSIPTSAAAEDEAAAERLWVESEALLARAGY